MIKKRTMNSKNKMKKKWMDHKFPEVVAKMLTVMKLEESHPNLRKKIKAVAPARCPNGTSK
jgi:hypothetical protein